MEHNTDAGSVDWLQRVNNWKVNHFSITEPNADAAKLLRTVAAALDELGDIQVVDITFSNQVEGPTIESKMNVYFLPNAPE